MCVCNWITAWHSSVNPLCSTSNYSAKRSCTTTHRPSGQRHSGSVKTGQGVQPACHEAIPPLPPSHGCLVHFQAALPQGRYPAGKSGLRDGATRQAQSRGGGWGTRPWRPGTLVGKQRLAYFSKKPELTPREELWAQKQWPRFAWDLTLGLSRPKSSWPGFPTLDACTLEQATR